MTKIFAHRGYSLKYPENTMLAFRKAYEYGADGIECDIQRTKDGILVIIHDEDLYRLTGDRAYVKDLTYMELLKYNFGKDKNFNEKLPKLENLLDYVKDKDILLNLELKTDLIRYSGIERQTISLVKNYGLEDRVIFSSFNYDSCKRINKLMKEKKAAFLFKKDVISLLKAIHNKLDIHPYYEIIEKVPFFKNLSKRVNLRAWTVNKKEDIEKMLNYGIDSIITNELELALNIRDKKNE